MSKIVRKLGAEEPRVTQYTSYEEMVTHIQEELNTTEKLILRVRWFIGCQAFILMENRKYRDHSVEEFAADLGLSPSSIYEARRLYIAYTKEDLDQRLIERQFTYRRALAMTRCKDADQRLLIENAAYEQELTDEEVDNLVKAANSGLHLPSDPNQIRAVVDDIARNKEDIQEKASAYVDDDDDDEVEDAERTARKNATADINGERIVLQKLRNACGDADRACTVLSATLTNATTQLDNMSMLSEEGYTQAEKAFMELAVAMKGATLTLYNAQKLLTSHNIVIRG